ncbi:MAG TPA: protein translocase subunit SecD [Gemmatimonadota bacterium]|nr:protein translocase subunit SecD [Gemmatimonadota bacterium]
MLSTIKGRLVVIGALLLLCVWALVPKTGPDGNEVSPINLGLDLQGGMHLAVEVADSSGAMTEQQKADAIDRTLTTIRNRINQFGVREPTIQKAGDQRIIVELAGIENPERAKEIVEKTAFLEFTIVKGSDELRRALPRMDRAIVDSLGPQSVGAPELGGAQGQAGQGRQKGLNEILGGGDTTAGGSDSAAAGSDTAAGGGADTSAADQGGSLRPLSALLLESGAPGEFLVAEQDVPTVRKYLGLPGVNDALPRNTRLAWGADPVGEGGNSFLPLYVLDQQPLVTGDQLADAGPATRDPTYNEPVVPFTMTRQGARMLQRGTSRHVGDQMAILLDGKVQSAPVIKQTLSRRAQIEMGTGSSLQEAQDLALILRAGALPVPIRIVEETTVGPSLGADSIAKGKLAFAIGIVLVVLIMIVYYRVAGFMAVGALCFYVLLVLGGLAGLNATLTLPGIAGLILSVGMAVDANVLIFERVREELGMDKTARTAVEAGFQHAMSAIVDSNLTTLITAAILFQFGTGAIKGFAVTLSIGIIASFFTAVFVTRTLFMVYLEKHRSGEPVSI